MARPRTPRRVELGEFLVLRRRSIDRGAVGLPPAPRRGRSGLSREEVAILSGISVSWYTWLEQGREINASRQVLDAVSRVLRLSDAERDYVRALADPDGRSTAGAVDPAIRSHLQRLVDALDFPAFIVGTDWAIIGWNARYEWLYGPIATLPETERNLLWLVYTDPRLREILPDWERDSRRFLAEYRAESGAHRGTGATHPSIPGSADRRSVVERLQEASPDFRAQWAEHSIERFASRLRTFLHPDEGRLVFEHHRLAPAESPGAHVVMYVPVAESCSGSGDLGADDVGGVE